MKLRIYNCPDSDFKPFVEKAFNFYASELVPDKRIRNNCSVTIKFKNNLDVYGYASITGHNTKKQARKFLIELHPGIGAKGILMTLAHEMVHIKQYIYNETDDELSMWRGICVDPTVDYWDHPWEIDAYGKENGLIYNFAVKNALWEIFADFINPTTPIIPEKIRWKCLPR